MLAELRSRIFNLADFSNIHTFAAFVGYPRSGHSLLGALLNAHPHMLVSHELNALHLVHRGMSQKRLFNAIVLRDRWWKEAGWKWAGWSYEVPGQYQGVRKEIRVIGDKKGGVSAKLIARHPEVLDELSRTLAVPIKFIHHVRNPFDIIATMSTRPMPGISSVDDAVREFVEENCVGVALAAQWAGHRMHMVRHEDLVGDPRRALRVLCEFLGEDVSPGYLEACAALVHPSPRRSREKIQWSARQINLVEEVISMYDFFKGYSLMGEA